MIILPEKNLPDITRPQEGQINWLHFVGINDVTLLKHALEPYGIHELVIEDILSRKQRPKIEDYGSYVFTAAQVYHYTSTGKLHSDQVYVIIGQRFCVVFPTKTAGFVQPSPPADARKSAQYFEQKYSVSCLLPA